MPAKKPYHKENLRRDLLEAGRDYVREHGHENLSIRMLAQQVGVSPGAPYHQFPDRRAFLLALAVDGFETLLDEHVEAIPEGLPPKDLIKNVAGRFVRFALDNPHMLELMYESELTRPHLDPQLQRFQERAHASGAALIMDCLPGISRKEADLRNITWWTSIYGLASMINKGIIRPIGDGEASIAEISDWVLDRAAEAAVGA